MEFEFATATRILFGAGMFGRVAEAVAQLGQQVLVVHGSRSPRGAALAAALSDRQRGVTLLSSDGEPTIDTVERGVQRAVAARCDVVIGLGGGSVLDTAKAIAALLTNGGHPLDYLEVIGRGESLRLPSAPCIAIPTTAGTGAEVTRNAVLGSPEHRVKVSLRSAFMLPRLAVVDPELTYDLPPDLTATTGLDAVTQLLEPFVSHQANPLTDAVCREGLRRGARGLPRAFADGADRAAREDMALASLCGGLALANARLGAVHGLAGPIGGMFPAPHGAVCAALLPHVMATNVQALRTRQPDSDSLQRYDEAARLLTGDHSATAAAGVEWVSRLCRDLQIPPLSCYGIRETDFAEIADQALRASSMRGNPVILDAAELTEILHRAL